MFDVPLRALAESVLAEARAKSLTLAAAESCTGGMICALLTEIPGSSDVVERGFVTYSNEAKIDLLRVAEGMIAEYGAVSEPVACAMARGALLCSRAQLSIAVTGIAGPGGGTVDKPVGLVHIAVARKSGETRHREYRFGDIGRDAVRLASVKAALGLLREIL